MNKMETTDKKYKVTPIKILELKSVTAEMKILLEGFESTFEQAEKRISEADYTTIEIIKSKAQKEKRLKKVNRA